MLDLVVPLLIVTRDMMRLVTYMDTVVPPPTRKPGHPVVDWSNVKVEVVVAAFSSVLP